MSIDDDMYDFEAFVEERSLQPEWPMKDTWDRLAHYISSLETSHEQLEQENKLLKTTVRVMMGITEESKNDMGN